MRPVLIEIDLPPVPVTIAVVLALARRHVRLAAIDIDWDSAPTGIWGREAPRSRIVRAGDRVEIYRRLPRDPRQARRARASAARRASGTVK
jgi:putative ubiquitin-RnfH superfamily antitoxin RatB of RatAB toxin-antitoxin module